MARIFKDLVEVNRLIEKLKVSEEQLERQVSCLVNECYKKDREIEKLRRRNARQREMLLEKAKK